MKSEVRSLPGLTRYHLYIINVHISIYTLAFAETLAHAKTKVASVFVLCSRLWIPQRGEWPTLHFSTPLLLPPYRRCLPAALTSDTCGESSQPRPRQRPRSGAGSTCTGRWSRKTRGRCRSLGSRPQRYPRGRRKAERTASTSSFMPSLSGVRDSGRKCSSVDDFLLLLFSVRVRK